jgi:glycosyltransferase involved in cell wall biosynthesis
VVVRRLLLVTSNFGGGTGRHIVGMLGYFKPQHWKIEILCQGRKELEPPGHVRVLELPADRRIHRFPVAQLRGLMQVRQQLVARELDVVHTYFFWPIVYGRILKQRGLIRHLVESREDQGFNLSSWNYRILRATAGLPDRVICVSEAVRQVVVERECVDEGRAVVIHNGIELRKVSTSSAAIEAVRNELGLSPAHLIVGMVANLNRAVKGVQYFVEAMPLILREVPEARFLILGGGPDEISLKARTEELGVQGHVVFAGFRPDIERFYPIIDVSVLTSLSEGLSMTLLESMNFAIPVVATHVGGNPEIVRDGESGFLVPPRDPIAFARRVVELLANPQLRRQMGRAGRTVVEQGFSLSRTASRYLNVYEETLKT